MKEVSHNYYDTFRPLLSIHPKFNVTSLIQDELQSGAASASSESGGLFSIFSFKSKTATPEYTLKLLRKKIKYWTEVLDNLKEEVRYQKKGLYKLKEVITKIFHEKKAQILKEKIREKFQYSEKEERAISKLEKMILRTLEIPCVGLLRWSDASIDKRFFCSKRNLLPKFQSRGFVELVMMPVRKVVDQVSQRPELKRWNSDGDLWKSSVKEKRAAKPKAKKVDPIQLQEKIALERRKLERMGCAQAVSVFDPRWGKGWSDKFLPRFKEVTEQAVVCAIASEIDAMQTLLAIHCILNNQPQQWKLLYLLGSLNYTTFVEILNSFDVGDLRKLNEILFRSRREELKWFENAIEGIRDGLIRDCNQMIEEVDQLAYRFRHNLEEIEISRLDIEKMSEMKDNIELRIKAVTVNLPILLKGVIINPETHHVLFSGLPKDYGILIKRLTEPAESPDCPAGCLFPILYRNVFEASIARDDDTPLEIFGSWNLFYPKDYFEAGLYGQITGYEFEKITKKGNAFAFQLGVRNLSKLGIKTILDFKQRFIFNRTLLEEFLLKGKNVDQLTQWTREALEG